MTSCNKRLILKSHKVLSFSWVRGLGLFSKSQKEKNDSIDEKEKLTKWGPKQESNSAMSGKDFDPKIFKDEPIPDHFMGYHLPDPVRNTEREYFQTHQNPNWEGHKRGVFDSRFYSKKYGISKEVYQWLHWDLNFNDNDQIDLWRKGMRYRMHKTDQRYLEDRMRILGPELAAAHFTVARGGAVKFVGREHWFVKDANGNYSLPRKRVDNLYVEAIDASNIPNLTYLAFDIFEPLQKVRFLKFKSGRYLDDWCLARLQRLKDSIEFLDIEDCEHITDNGISSLHCLKKLQGLRLSNLPRVKHLGLLTLQLEEHIPGLKVLGVKEDDLNPPAWQHRGEGRLVRALLGYFDDESDPDTFAKPNEIPVGNYEDDSYIYNRRVLKAD